MTKEDKMYEVYGGSYDWDENGWLLYGCDEGTESGVEPFGNYETRNHIDGYYEWRPIELQGIEDNNGWIKIESEDDLPQKFGEYKFIYNDRIIQMGFNPKMEDLKNCAKVYSHWKSIDKDKFPIH